MARDHGSKAFLLDNRQVLESLWNGVRDDLRGLFRRLGRRLGRVREVDVTAHLLTGLQLRLSNSPLDVCALGARVENARRRRSRRLIKSLDSVDLRGVGRHIASAPHGFAVVTSFWRDSQSAVRAFLSRRADSVE
jgi:hypothetical protein